MDGRPEKHDSRRCLKGGQPTFNRIIDNIILAQELSLKTRISVRVNIDKNNDEDFVWLYNHIKNLNLPNVFVYPGFVVDISGKDCNSCLYNSNDITRFLINLYEKHGILIPFFYPDGRIASCSVRNANSTVIGPKGELYKCWNDVGDPSKVYGSIFGKPMNESILYKYLTGADHLSDPVCQECKFLPICNGGCPYIRLQEEAHGKRSDKNCLLFKKNIKDFLWIHYQSKNQRHTLNHNF